MNMSGSSLTKNRHGHRKSPHQLIKCDEEQPQVTTDQIISKEQHLKEISSRSSMSNNTELSIGEDDTTNFLVGHDSEDVIILPRGGVIYKQFAYHKNSEGQGGTYYKCSLYRSKHCMARLVQRDGQFKEKGQEHNHSPPETAANLINSFLGAQNCYTKDESTNGQSTYGDMTASNGKIFNMDPAFADFLEQNGIEDANETMEYTVERTDDQGGGFQRLSSSLAEPSRNTALPKILAKSRIEYRVDELLSSKTFKQGSRPHLNNQTPKRQQFHQLQSFSERQSTQSDLESGWNHVKCPKVDEQEDSLEEVISVNENTQQNDRLRIVIERSDQLRQLVGLEFERTGNIVKIKIAPKSSFIWQKTDE